MPGSTVVNQPVSVLDRWQKTGDNTNIQKFQQLSGGIGAERYSLATQSNLAVESASFIRLKNVSISYTFPREMVNYIHLRDLSVYVQAQNLFTITNYSGADPESLNLSTLAPLRLYFRRYQISTLIAMRIYYKILMIGLVLVSCDDFVDGAPEKPD